MQVLAWGKGNSGALGLIGSDKNTVLYPSQITSLDGKEICNISSGEGHTLVCLKDGKVFSCGSNDCRQCGRDTNLNKLDPVEEGLQPHHVIQVAAGASHSVVLTQAHEVLTWGKNTEGQLGRGDVDDSSRCTPKLVKSLAVYGVLQVACGNDHNIVLTSEGNVATWGSNSYGQLGLGENKGPWINLPSFINCLNGLPITQVAAGGNHCVILSKSGAVYAWGRNSFGQLGLNNTSDLSLPHQCRPLRSQGIKFISCGENHTACLTKDGRVFTFGAGTNGQLGHGSYNNEPLPRQVIELSGSEVSQIACGREHTVAFIPKSGRLYSFGLNESGQLGLLTTGNRNSPIYIPGFFNSAQAADISPTLDQQSLGWKVKSIYAGGDHSFAVTKDLDTTQPDEYRKEDPERQILTLSQFTIERLQSAESSDITFNETIDEMVKIFSNASCLNGSFFLINDEHYNTTSKKHGVDMNAVRTFFQDLAKLANVDIIQKISEALEQSLYPSLPQSPPDVEALRLYLILPECPLFDQPKLYNSIICPFAKSFLSLDKVALNVFNSWWPVNQPSFFNRLIWIYKNCIEYLLKLPNANNQIEADKRQAGLLISMEMLKILYEINEAHNQIIPYENFYVPELKNKVNIQDDFISLILRTNQQSQLWGAAKWANLHFCNYPFLFDGAAKSVLLQTDAAFQMHNAVMTACQISIMSCLSPLPIFDPMEPCLILKVLRNTIVQDTLSELQTKHRYDLKKPLKVIFLGEEALDGGGLKKEFFLLLMREILDPANDWFELDDSSNLHWFKCKECSNPKIFHMIGVLCGLAIYNGTIINLQFPLALYKKLLKKPVTIDDFKELNPVTGRSLQNLLDYDGDDVEDKFYLFFEHLCPDGLNKMVDHNNKQEYIDLYVDYVLNKSVEVQFKAFNDGFHCVCGGNVLDLFHPQELQAMVVGNEDYDFTEFEKNTDYKNDYHKDHPIIKMFWEVFHEMSMEDKKKFLLFLTGSDRIPIFGMTHVKMTIQPVNWGEKFLPAAHTCFNLLDLPRYTSKATLKTKLLIAIQQTEGFGMV